MAEPILFKDEFNCITINPLGVKFLYKNKVYLDFPTLVEISGVSRSKMHRLISQLDLDTIKITYLGKSYFLETFCIQFINFNRSHNL
jgi:hypothetical protein